MHHRFFLQPALFWLMTLFSLLLAGQALAAAGPAPGAGRPPALMAAALRGSPAEIENLLKAGADPNAADARGMRALMYAAMSNAPVALELLLKAGSRPGERNLEGKTALHLAAEFNPDPAVAQLLLKAGAILDEADDLGRTPLMYAAARNTPAVVGSLLAAGASCQARDAKGKTAYDYTQGILGSYNQRLAGTPEFWQLYRQQYGQVAP